MMNPADGLNRLEQTRRIRGNDACRACFLRLLKSERQKALSLLNDPGLTFPTLFLLEPEIVRHGMENEISTRNRTAIRLCSVILSENKTLLSANARDVNKQETRTVLLWMFLSGTAGDGFSDEFDHILDISAAVLLKKYREDSILSPVSRLIFRRNRRGAFLHDLVWAFFQTHSVKTALSLLAGYLLSQNSGDRRLAALLLHLSPAGNSPEAIRRQYRGFMKWLGENSPYLYYTWESLLSSNEPNTCGIDLGAKYLGKRIFPENRRPESPLTKAEQNSLSCFLRTDDDGRKKLAGYSHRIHGRNPGGWRQWMSLPVDLQLRAAQEDGRRLV